MPSLINVSFLCFGKLVKSAEYIKLSIGKPALIISQTESATTEDLRVEEEKVIHSMKLNKQIQKQTIRIPRLNTPF